MILYYHQEDRKISLNMMRYIATSIEHFEDDNSIKLRNVSTPAMKNFSKSEIRLKERF
jgi:ribosomal protein S1